MTRAKILEKIVNNDEWDLIVIGGGASGLGVALDAISRNLKVLLVEKHDFGKGTSSRSTKLVHGGVRYLQQGNITLVREALKERAYILEKAAHNAHLQPFVIPFFNIWSGLYYFIGLKIYDLLSGSRRIGKTKWLSKSQTLEKLPNIRQKGLKGGIRYFDGQFDDARLCIDLVRTILDKGGVCINYMMAKGFIKDKTRIKGVYLRDLDSHKEYAIKSKVVVNATGIFADDILQMDDSKTRKTIVPSRGSHLTIDYSFLSSDHAIMIPKTSDGRVLFLIPWLEKVIIGTTDVKTDKSDIEPKVNPEEINFILQNARNYLEYKPKEEDIQSVFAGLRPLAAPKKENQSTREISRGHQIIKSDSGLYTLIGGKWTTFRKMGEDTLKLIIADGKLPDQDSTSARIIIAKPLISLTNDSPADYILNHTTIQYYIEKELALKVEDILARRTRTMLLNVKKANEEVGEVAKIMQNILGKSDEWRESEIINSQSLFTHCMPPLIN